MTEKPLTKTAFIRSLPIDMPARDVVDRAKAAGLSVAESYVYEIRSTSKRAGNAGTAKGARASKSSATKRGKPSKAKRVIKATPAKAKATKRAGARDSSKRRFIEGLPTDTPVVEVVALAKKAGIALSGNYVYKLRRAAGAGAKSTRRDAKSKLGGLTGKWSGKSPKHLEEAFIDAALDLGLARASQLLERVRSKLKRLAV